MRRAALILFHVTAALSLLLCAMALGLWGWGRSHTLKIARWTPMSMSLLDVSRGELSGWTFHPLHGVAHPPDDIFGWTCRAESDSEVLADAARFFPRDRPAVAGFFVHHVSDEGGELTVILLPMWFVVLLFALLPLIEGVHLARRRRRSRRLADGCCIACGYDLRASPEKCPECGRASSSAGG